MDAPIELIGILAVDKDGVPLEVPEGKRSAAVLRKATHEPEVMPAPAEFNAVDWDARHS